MKYFTIILFLSVSACNANNSFEVNDKNITDGGVTLVNVPDTSSTSSNITTVKPTPPPAPTTTPVITTTPATKPSTASTTTTKPTDPTTPKPSPTPAPHSTSAPVTTTAAPHHHDRKFDGPSFVGGIILAFGLVAIGFVSFRFYKSRSENYRTL